METKYCKDCAHFHQHYALNKRKLFRVCCGHCTSRNIKKRQPDTIACDDYVFALPDENAFATKEYLSRELLQYLLNLELLPVIENTKDS